jgi:hypothetical protein
MRVEPSPPSLGMREKEDVKEEKGIQGKKERIVSKMRVEPYQPSLGVQEKDAVK